MTKKTQYGSTVQSLVKALNLLKLFASGQKQWHMAELVAELGYHKSSVQRLLFTLESQGFLERTPENQVAYRLGLEALALGFAAQ